MSKFLHVLITKAQKRLADNLTVSLALLGSAHVKAAHRTLMKLTPEVDFNNILQAFFIQKCFWHHFSTYNLAMYFFGAKAALKM